MNILSLELKRAVRTPAFWILFALALAFTASVCLLCRAEADRPSAEVEMVYGFGAYADFQELEAEIETFEAALERALSDLEETGNLSPQERAAIEENIRALQTSLNAMRLLLDGEIPFSAVEEYGSLDEENGASAAVNLLYGISMVLGPVCGAKIALRIPSERREGQAGLTFLLPVGKAGYSALRALSDLTVFALLLLLTALTMIPFLLSCFPGSGLVLAATPTAALLMDLPGAMGFSLAMGLFFLLCCAGAGWALSLLLKSPPAALLCTLFACLGGPLPELLDRAVFGRVLLSRWMFSCQLRPEAAFSGGDPLWFSLAVALVWLAGLLALALLRFRRSDG